MNQNIDWQEERRRGMEAIEGYDLERAQEHLEAALRELEAGGNGSSPDAEDILNQLAQVFRFRNEYAASLQTFHRLLQLQQELHGEKDPSLTPTYQAWADTCAEAGDFKEAEQLSWRGIDVFLPHARIVLTAYGELLDTLAHAERMQGDLDGAIEHARASMHILEMADGQKDLGLLAPLQTYVAALKTLGDSLQSDNGSAADQSTSQVRKAKPDRTDREGRPEA